MSLYCKTATSIRRMMELKKSTGQRVVRKHTLKYLVAKCYEGLQLTLKQFKSVCMYVLKQIKQM